MIQFHQKTGGVGHGNQPYIVGVGAANLDLNGASCAPIHLRDSNPGHISLSAGGVTRNVC